MARAACVIEKDDKYLLILRKRNGEEYYVFPGGSIEDNETPELAAIREAKEELSFDVKISELLFEIDNRGQHEYWYKVEASSDNEPRLGGPEVDRQSENNSYNFVWMSKNEALNLSNIYPVEAVAKLKQYN